MSVFNFNQLEIFGIFLLVILIILTTAAGVGGDVLMIPIIKVLFGFSSLHSIALSQICTAVSTLIRLVFTYKNRNPYRDAPEIDYNVGLIFAPSLFLGSNIGLILSYFIPNVIVSILLITILLFTAHKTFLLGVTLWKSEVNEEKARFYTVAKDKYK